MATSRQLPQDQCNLCHCHNAWIFAEDHFESSCSGWSHECHHDFMVQHCHGIFDTRDLPQTSPAKSNGRSGFLRCLPGWFGSGSRVSWGRIPMFVWHMRVVFVDLPMKLWKDAEDWTWLMTRSLKTPPKFNSEFTPEKWWERFRRSSFLLGLGNFSRAFAVKFREGMFHG